MKYIGDDMTITVFDEDVTSSDKVGSNVVKLSALCVNGGLDEWYQLQHQGKNCGSIHLRGHWTPHAMGVKVVGPGMQQPVATVVIQQPMGYQ